MHSAKTRSAPGNVSSGSITQAIRFLAGLASLYQTQSGGDDVPEGVDDVVGKHREVAHRVALPQAHVQCTKVSEP
jgi:hypothetical protein